MAVELIARSNLESLINILIPRRTGQRECLFKRFGEVFEQAGKRGRKTVSAAHNDALRMNDLQPAENLSKRFFGKLLNCGADSTFRPVSIHCFFRYLLFRSDYRHVNSWRFRRKSIAGTLKTETKAQNRPRSGTRASLFALATTAAVRQAAKNHRSIFSIRI